MTDPRTEVDALRDRLAAGERGASDADREFLLGLSNNLDLIPSEIGDYRHRDLLRRGAQISEGVDVALEALVDDREAVEEVVRWVNRTYDNENTNQNFRRDLRAIVNHYLQVDEPAESVAWVPTGTSNDYDPVPSERDLLDYERDLLPMVDACHNRRDKALLKVQFEAGLRGGELYDVEVGDVFDGAHSTGLHVDGKQGERAVHLIVATPELQQWLAAHPARDDPDAPLFSKLDSAEQPSYNALLDWFRRAAARVDVDKAVTPTNFRKSNTRWLVRLGFSQPEIEDRQGRARGSDHTANYMARFGEKSLERTYAALHGKDVETDSADPNTPVECPRCGEQTPRERGYCVWCDAALSHDAVSKAKAVDDAHVESAAQSTGQLAEDIVELNRVRSPAITRRMVDDE